MLLGASQAVLLGASKISGTELGRYAPFPFVTRSNPPLDHSGVKKRPGYSPTDPRSASVIDPMSGIELFRVGGNCGSAVLINGKRNSGLRFPHKLRTDNLGIMQKVWNADTTLLMVDRYFPRSDRSDLCRSYIVDVTGAYSNRPWRIIRASRKAGLGDGVGQRWVWDPNDPLRAYVFRDDGSVDEWWPVGGPGHGVGEVNTLFGPVYSYTNWATATRSRLHTSPDGQYAVTGCRESTGARRWGGCRLNLITGELGPFIPTPDTFNTDSDRAAMGISYDGLYTSFSPNGALHRFYNTETGAFESDTGGRPGLSYSDWAEVNGHQYMAGPRTDTINLFDITTGTYREVADIRGANPNHCSCRNFLDRFEIYGPAGGATSGLRYLFYSRSNPRKGHPRGILGVRLGPRDHNVIRYICNHRSIRKDNSSECHAIPSPDASFVAFPSNWREANTSLRDDVHPYVASLPDAWYSPNNDGS